MDLVPRRAHAPGTAEPRSFEDALRELLHDSPFFALSALLHALLLVLFAVAPEPPAKDPARVIVAEAPEEPPPPPPLPPPPEPPPLDVPEIHEDPSPVDRPAQTPLDADSEFEAIDVADAHDLNRSELGLGVGPPVGSGGPPGGPHRRPPSGPLPVVASVYDALDWLARHQGEDGSWSSAGFDARCVETPPCDGAGNPEFDVGVTGLALLAFLGAAETPKRGDHRDTVRRGLKYLTEVQEPDGNFGNRNLSRHTYDHAIATLAMVEAYDLTGGERLYRDSAQRGLAHLSRIRNPGGAWRYADFHPDMALAPDDVSVTGWAILAMASARKAGLPYDDDAMEDALLFLDEMTDPATGVTGYTERGGRPARMQGPMAELWPAEQSESMTAVAVLCRIFADPELERAGAREAVERGAAVLGRTTPLWSDDRPGRRDYYYWYYGSYALYQVGGRPWRDWEVTLIPAIAEQQLAQGDARGSWDPQHDPWGGEGGRVYSTSILALTMEVFSRYPTVMGPH